MKLNRSVACALTGAALVASAFAAPAAMASDAAGSVTVPLGSSGGCTKSVTVYWDTTKPVPVGTAGNVTC